jgi:hypothetical protein
MTGWRVGWVVGNAGAIDALARLKTNWDSGIWNGVQRAAIAALTGPQDHVEESREVYRRRRDLLVEALRREIPDAEIAGIRLRFEHGRVVEATADSGWGAVDRTGRTSIAAVFAQTLPDKHSFASGLYRSRPQYRRLGRQEAQSLLCRFLVDRYRGRN